MLRETIILCVDGYLFGDRWVDASTLALQVIGGFTLGAIIGYVLRKAAKWVLIIIGIFLLPVVGLWYLGVLDVNWAGLNELVGRLVEWLGVNLSDLSMALASTGALGISGLIGLMFGLSGGFRHTVFDTPKQYKFIRRKGK